jgi:hypothetical protein
MALVFLFLVMLKIFREKKNPIILFVPVSYLLFQAQSWENMTWAMAALQNYSSLLFVLLSLYFWNKRTIWAYSASGALGIIATYTSGNGLLIFLILLIWEICNVLNCIKINYFCSIKKIVSTHRQLPILLISVICVCYLYFNDYHKPPHHPSIFETVLKPTLLLQYMGVLIGSYLEYLGKTLAFLIGMVEIIMFIVLTVWRYDRKNPVIYYFLLFIFFSIFIAGLGRAGFGIDQALSPRYRILALMALILIFLALIESFPNFWSSKRIVAWCLVVLAVGFNIGSTKIAVQCLTWRKNVLIQGIREWKKTGEGLNYPDQKRASLLLEQSIKKGMYHVPSL